MSSVHSLDTAQTVSVVVGTVAAMVVTMMARQTKKDVATYKEAAKYTGDVKNPREKRANVEDTLLQIMYIFAGLFLIVYVGFIGYREGMHKGTGGALPVGGESTLKGFSTSMVVLAYVLIVVLVLSSSFGIDIYKSAATFGNVTTDKPKGDKYRSAKGLYATSITTLVIAVIVFVLLTAYLGDAKSHAIRFYESWSSSAPRSIGSSFESEL